MSLENMVIQGTVADCVARGSLPEPFFHIIALDFGDFFTSLKPFNLPILLFSFLCNEVIITTSQSLCETKLVF